ncbi:hypothetical protein BDR07DRAFT_1498363 [Suillus spraguei]|nr:hypothetical protein BDR07DRAFT_1498363 [Suillus spraguei]
MADGLPLSGTRFALLERLRNFAASKEEWLSSVAYCYRSLKLASAAYLNLLRSENTEYTQTSKETPFRHNGFSPSLEEKWNAGKVVLGTSCRHLFWIGTNLRPVLGPVKVQQDASASIEATGSHRGDNEEETSSLACSMRCFERHLFNRVNEVENKIDQVLRFHQLKSTALPADAVQVSPIPTVQSEQHLLPLGDEDFLYDKSKLQGPPLIHFSGDIERLCREWKESNLLTVNGRGIPVKYWGEFFKKSKGRAHSVWDSIKVEWGNCKRRWERFSDADAFWSEYSNPETHNKLLYQQILNRLVVRRAEKAAQDAADAREFFGGNLDCPDADGAFQYSKRGRTHLLSKDDTVAKRWKELLNTRPDITPRLAQMRSAQRHDSVS